MKLSTLAPLLLLTACTVDPTSVHEGDIHLGVAVGADGTSPTFTVEVKVENRSELSLYVIDYCGDTVVPRLERLEHEEWVMVPHASPCRELNRLPIILGRGMTVTGVATVHEPGLYRARIRVASGLGITPTWDTVSREFEVTT
jgi:hypothetical protein